MKSSLPSSRTQHPRRVVIKVTSPDVRHVHVFINLVPLTTREASIVATIRRRAVSVPRVLVQACKAVPTSVATIVPETIIMREATSSVLASSTVSSKVTSLVPASSMVRHQESMVSHEMATSLVPVSNTVKAVTSLVLVSNTVKAVTSSVPVSNMVRVVINLVRAAINSVKAVISSAAEATSKVVISSVAVATSRAVTSSAAVSRSSSVAVTIPMPSTR